MPCICIGIVSRLCLLIVLNGAARRWYIGVGWKGRRSLLASVDLKGRRRSRAHNQRDEQSVKSDPKVTRGDHLSSKCGIGAIEIVADHQSCSYHKVTCKMELLTLLRTRLCTGLRQLTHGLT